MWTCKDFAPFEKTIYLSSPTMHAEERKYVQLAFDTNWMSCLGNNIDEIERHLCELIGCRYAVALSCGTAAVHLALKLAGEAVYGKSENGHHALEGRRVFVSDTTFAATVNPIVYEGGRPVFIDMERETWNMDPVALDRAFDQFPDVKIVVLAYLYGTPAKMDEILEVCERRGAILVEDAAEALGSKYRGRAAGSFGRYNVISFNGNKIITGSAGGVFLSDEKTAYDKVKKWSTQSREIAPWYQHEEIGYNYRMSNVIAGIIRGQFFHLDEHITLKKAIYSRYREGLKDLPVTMNPIDFVNSEPNYWLSCMLIDPDAMCSETRGTDTYSYIPEHGKSCPMEILEALQSINAQGRPIWKPMHMQPYFAKDAFVAADGNNSKTSVGRDVFNRGLCLPSDIKMTPEEQDQIIEVIRNCFE